MNTLHCPNHFCEQYVGEKLGYKTSQKLENCNRARPPVQH